MNAAPLELTVLFDDVLAVVRSARSATLGWRSLCVRARRTLGTPLVGPLSELDLDADVDALAPIVRRLLRAKPRAIETLVFELFEPLAVDDEPLFAGFRLAGVSAFDARSRWLAGTPEWQPAGAHLPSHALDVIVRAETTARRAQKAAVSHALRFGAAALIARGVTGGEARVVVAFEQGEAYEVAQRAGIRAEVPAAPLG